VVANRRVVDVPSSSGREAENLEEALQRDAEPDWMRVAEGAANPKRDDITMICGSSSQTE
jgi:hypothetical protein